MKENMSDFYGIECSQTEDFETRRGISGIPSTDPCKQAYPFLIPYHHQPPPATITATTESGLLTPAHFGHLLRQPSSFSSSYLFPLLHSPHDPAPPANFPIIPLSLVWVARFHGGQAPKPPLLASLELWKLGSGGFFKASRLVEHFG